jgi:hypothetical protein
MNTRFHFWNVFFLLFFLVVAKFMYLWLERNGLLIPTIPLFDFFLMTLAVQRLTRLFAYDVVTEFFRNWFSGHDPRSLLGTMGALLACPWCTGLWFALLIVFAYFATPVAWYAILVLALGSLGSFVQIITNLVGWSAELKKQKSLTHPH